VPLNPLQRAAIAVFSAIEAARECVATNANGINPRNNGDCSGLVAALSESALGRSLSGRLWGFGNTSLNCCSPKRADLVAALGETTGEPAFRAIRDRMRRCESGRELLRLRPRMRVSAAP